MATCPDCYRDIAESASCTRTHFQLVNRLIPRIPYGEERRPPTWYSHEEYCDDCGVEIGGVHHRDCAIEQCPMCGDYAAVCNCFRQPR